MKVGVVSDTHIPSLSRYIPEALWRGLEGCEHLIHAGDFETLEIYEEFNERFPFSGVKGNRDLFNDRGHLPDQRIIELEGFTIGITHGFGSRVGLPERVRKGWTEPVDLLVFGHSHQVGIYDIDGLKLLNPGSPTDFISAARQTFALLNLGDTIEIEIHELDS